MERRQTECSSQLRFYVNQRDIGGPGSQTPSELLARSQLLFPRPSRQFSGANYVGPVSYIRYSAALKSIAIATPAVVRPSPPLDPPSDVTVRMYAQYIH